MILKICSIVLIFNTNRNNLIEAMLAKFLHFQTFSSRGKNKCLITEVLPEQSNDILLKYDLSTIRDTYNFYLNKENTLLFESFDDSFVLTDLTNNEIFFCIKESERLLEHTIIVKLFSHLFFYLTKHDLYNIHCSCTTINNDINNCVAFVGNKHSGKTTLALHMYSQGENLICDDSLLFEVKSFKAIPNITPPKAYLNDINRIGSPFLEIGSQLYFDDNKYQVECISSKFESPFFVSLQNIVILHDHKESAPYIHKLERSEFIMEMLKRATINEYCFNKIYLKLLEYLSSKNCYLLIPSIDSQKTHKLIKDLFC